jgi:DNA-binding response OmpR family regulator
MDYDEIRQTTTLLNEFLSKPIRIDDLILTIRRLSKKHIQTVGTSIDFQKCKLDPTLNIFTNSQGTKVKLTDKETKIIQYLFKEKGKFISKEILLNRVWGYKSEISTHTLETHIYRLRKKIELDPKNPVIIITCSGGYHLGV